MADLWNQDLIKGKWREVKGDLRKAWGRLTDDELEESKGDMTAIGGLIQQKYGLAKEEVRSKLNELAATFNRDRKEDPLTEQDQAVADRLRDQNRQI